MMLQPIVFLLSLTCSFTVQAGKPGQLLPLLQPHPNKGRRSLVPPTLLQPTKSLPGGSIINLSVRGISRRAVACQDPTYTLCTDQSKCCPVEGSCCTGDSCCPSRFACCAAGDCCPQGYTCATVNGKDGCCPNGQTCTTTTGQCAQANYVACPGENFCCPPGEQCTTLNGQPACGASSATSAGPTAITSAKPSAKTTSSKAGAPPPAASSNAPPAASNPPTPSAAPLSTSLVVVVPSVTTTGTTSAMIPTTMSNLTPLGFSTTPTTDVPLTIQGGVPTNDLNPTGSGSGAGRRFAVGSAGVVGVATLLVGLLQII